MQGALIAVIRPANSCNCLDAFHTYGIQPERKYQSDNRSDGSRIGVLGIGACFSPDKKIPPLWEKEAET